MSKKTTIQFTALTFAIALAAWGICIAFGQFGITSEKHRWLYVPYVLGGLSPTIASFIALKKNGEVKGFREWVKNIFSFKCPARFYLLTISLNLAYIIPQIIINGTGETNPPYLFIIFIPMMLFGGGLEEAGWRYILQPTIDKKYGYFLSAAIVSVIWAMWHLPLFYIPGTVQYTSDFWPFAILTVGLTFALGAIRKISDSVFLCVLFHCVHNAGSATFNIPDALSANTLTSILLILASSIVVLKHKPQSREHP